MKKTPVSLLRNAVIFLLGISASNITIAQQIPLYDQYYINPFIINPSLTGSSGTSSAYLIHRTQWQGIDGAPVTNALTFDSPILKDKISVGFAASQDKTGPVLRTETMGAISYRARFSPQQSLIFGLSVGILDNSFNLDELKVRGDLNGVELPPRRTNPTANFGITYQYNRLEVGAVLPQLFSNVYPTFNEADARNYSLSTLYMGSLKYTFDVNKDQEITAYPLVVVRGAANTPLLVEGNGVLNWPNVGWVALSYKNNLSYGFNLGLQHNGFKLGFVYEVPTGAVASYGGSSNEILLGYTFGKLRIGKWGEESNEQPIATTERRTERQPVPSQAVPNNRPIASDNTTAPGNRLLFKRADGLKVNVGEVYLLKNVNFEHKSIEYTDESTETLDELVAFLNNNPTVKIEVDGFADDTGTDEFNDKLSKERAQTVAEYLVGEGEIKASRITYRGLGKRQPIVKVGSERERAKNRRVEFKVISK